MKILDLFRKDKPLKDDPIDRHLIHLDIALQEGEITKEEYNKYIDELYQERCL